MQSDDPAHLSVGTEVSAKFKGAFCEAKIKKVTKSIKCKVLLKEPPFGSITVDNTSIKADLLEINQIVDVHHNKQTVKAMIQSIKDCSTYHVVFNDGDEKVLRRTQMCLKGNRHFSADHNLDALPLYNPEQFGNPVVKGKYAKDFKLKKRKMEDNSPQKRKRRKEEDESDEEGSKKREKRAAASAASVAIGEMDQGDTEISCDGSSSGDASDVEKEKERERKKDDKREKSVARSSVARSPPEEKGEKYSVGEVVCVFEDASCKGKWFPAVVVSHKAYRKSPKPRPLARKGEQPLRSFQNGKYYLFSMGALSSQLTSFEEQKLTKKVLEAMSSATRAAVERAQAFIEKETMPGNWERSEIYGDEEPSPSKRKEHPEEKKKELKNKEKEKDEKEKKKEKEKEKEKKVETESSSSEDSEEEEYGEERDLFVAQLYKFQEERGTPINKAPVLGRKDIDLYRFYRLVQHYGGAKKVTANQKWKRVLQRMKLEGCPGATPVTVKNAYIRYLAHFNSFYKNLGWSMEELASSSTTSSPRERRLIRGAMDGKNKVLKKKKTEEKKKEPGEKESTMEKESSVESSTLKDEKNEKEKEKEKKEMKTTEKGEKHEPPIEKERRERKDTEKEKYHDEEKEKSKEVEHKKEEKKKEDKEKKKTERKKEDSESTDVGEKEKSKEQQSKPSTSQASDKRDKTKVEKVEKSVEKETKRDRKLTESEDEVDGKKKKERRKVSIKEKSSKAEEELIYHQADVFSQFYQGQKIKAYHHGKWYDARVVNKQQHALKQLMDYLVEHQGTTSGDQLSEEIKTYLKNAIDHANAYVHYLGWNSRYDETINLHKMRVNHKDMEASQNHFKAAEMNRMCESFKTVLLAWVRGPEAIVSLEEEETVGSVIGMGGYRPRRVSISQYEQIAAAMERAQKKGMQSPPPRSTSISIHPTKTEDVDLKPDVKSLQGTSGYVIPKRTAASPGRPKNERPAEVAVKREVTSPVPSVPEPIPTPPGPSKPVEKEKPVEPPTVSSPKFRRQRTISASSRTTPPIHHVSPPTASFSHPVIRRVTPRDTQTPPPEDPPIRPKSPAKSSVPILLPTAQHTLEERSVPADEQPSTSQDSITPLVEEVVEEPEELKIPVEEKRAVPDSPKEELVEKVKEKKLEENVEKKEEKPVEKKKELKEDKPAEKKEEKILEKKEEKQVEKKKEEKTVEKKKHDKPAEVEEKKTELPKATKLPEIPKELKKKEEKKEKKTKEHKKEKEKEKEKVKENKKETKVEEKKEKKSEKKEERKKKEEKRKIEEKVEDVKEEPTEEEVEIEEEEVKVKPKEEAPSTSAAAEEKVPEKEEEKEEIKEELVHDADDEAEDEAPTPSMESSAILSPSECSPVRQPPPKRRRVDSEKEVKEDEEEEEEEVDDEEELDQLEEEAKLVCSMQDDQFSDSGSTTPHREDIDDEPEFRDLNAPRPRPGIMSPMRGGRSVKKRRLLNARHSAMVVDKKYLKHKPKDKPKETPPPPQPQPTTEDHHSENEEDEEESLKIKESYVKRKNNMYKQLEIESKLEDYSILEAECIDVLPPPTANRQADDDFVEFCESRLQELRQMYLAARTEIQLQEKRMRAVQERKREHRDKEKQHREQLSSPSQSSTSTATDSL